MQHRSLATALILALSTTMLAGCVSESGPYDDDYGRPVVYERPVVYGQTVRVDPRYDGRPVYRDPRFDRRDRNRGEFAGRYERDDPRFNRQERREDRTDRRDDRREDRSEDRNDRREERTDRRETRREGGRVEIQACSPPDCVDGVSPPGFDQTRQRRVRTVE